MKAPPDIEELALKEGVKIFRDNIIYKLIESYENWVAEERLKETYEKALKRFSQLNPRSCQDMCLGGVAQQLWE